MSRFTLAFSCFFRLLVGKQVRPEVVEYLPENAIPKQLPDPTTKDKEEKERKIVERVVEKIVERPVASGKVAQHHRDGALALLALLQREGRLVDFLRESLDGHADADIGAAARDVHRGCKKVLDQHLAFEPVMPGEEETKVSVPKGFDPAEIRLIGEATGEPPYKGTLRHHGWRVTDTKLPTLADGIDRTVIAPAEVELSA